jgi:hypothetical protein
MATQKEVKNYRVNVAAHPDGFNEWRAMISLYDENGASFGTIHFTDELSGRDNEINLTGHSTIWAPLDAYHRILDLLRNEKPIFLWLYETGRALISTSLEPVGEEESSF